MLMAGDLEMGHARALLTLEPAQQILAANEVAAKKLSVRETEKLATRAASGGRQAPLLRVPRDKPRDIARLEEQLADRTGSGGGDPAAGVAKATKAGKKGAASQAGRSPSGSVPWTNSTACSKGWARATPDKPAGLAWPYAGAGRRRPRAAAARRRHTGVKSGVYIAPRAVSAPVSVPGPCRAARPGICVCRTLGRGGIRRLQSQAAQALSSGPCGAWLTAWHRRAAPKKKICCWRAMQRP